jgi:hypothetical protein
VGEHDCSAIGRRPLEFGDERIAPGDHLMEALAPWTTVLEQLPSGMDRVDLGGCQSFVVAVVVLDKCVDLGCLHAGYGTTRRLPSALQRAGEDQRQGPVRKRRQQGWQPVGLATPLVDQRQVGAPRVLAAFRPLRRTMADEQDQRWAGNR